MIRGNLHNAAEQGQRDAVADFLAYGTDVNARTVSGDTPLHRAAKAGRKEVAELLLTKGAKVNAKDNKGWTPLHEAVCNNKKEIVVLLLAAGADINAKRQNENTPFHDAAYRGQTQIVKLLLAAGSGVNTRDEDGFTALDRAVSHHDWSLTALLLRRGGRMSSGGMLSLAWKWVGIPLIALSCWGGLAFGSTLLMQRLCPLLPTWAARGVGIASIPFAAFCTTVLLTDKRRRKPLLIAWGLFALCIALLSHQVSPWFTSWEGVIVFASLAGAIACPLVLVLPETALGAAARAIRAITVATRRALGGLASARGQGEARRRPRSRRETVGTKTEWERFFLLASIHYKSFVGLWPPGVDLASLNSAPFEALIKRLHAHISGCHPGRDSKPEYLPVDGKIARRSNPIIDAIVYHALPRKKLTATCKEEIPAVVWRLIERHSRAPLAKLLFALPYMRLVSAKEAGMLAVLFVNHEDIPIYRDLRTDQILQIQIYKGVENTIFGAYRDLPEGGYLTDQAINRKLRSLAALNRERQIQPFTGCLHYGVLPLRALSFY